MAIYMWREYIPKTFTVSRTENSNPSQFNPTYSDDAAWLTAWSTDFDEFFGYSAVTLSTSWVETAEVTQEQSWWAWKLDMSSLSWGFQMIKFPVRWIKMTKSWSTVTLSITEWLNMEWYQYYAFQTWTLANPWTPNDAFYMWAYMWYVASSKLSSASWVLPTIDSSSYQYWQRTFITLAKGNGSWFNIEWFYQREYINALYMMKYWNPYSQNIIWVWRNTRTNTWLTKSLTDATWSVLDSWTSTYWVRLFWLEDRWGQWYEYIGWAYRDNSDWKLYTALSWWTWTATDISNFEDTWVMVIPDTYGTMQAIIWTNKWMFAPLTWTNWTDYTVYYTDNVTYSANWLLIWWWYASNALWGVFNLGFTASTSSYNNNTWARLMYMNWLT